MEPITIPVYKPSLTGNEKKYVLECLETTWISSKGRFVSLFEQEFSKYIGVKYATSVSNGTVALHLALLALGIQPGDEVIVPTLTYIASVNAISYMGARPVFVDSLQDTWQMDPTDVVKKITPKTKAILAVHLYGHPCEMNELSSICRSNNLFLVEDCAEAIGSSYDGKLVGSFGDIATFSFFGNKTITTGEGGMVVTNNPNLNEICVHLKSQAVDKDKQYWHDMIGYNYRMTNICAAIGVAQLEQISQLLSKKRQVVNWYRKYLKSTSIILHEESNNVFHSYWMFTILASDEKERGFLRHKLSTAGIETRPLFYPVHHMPPYKSEQNCPVAENLSMRGINLPSYPSLNETDVIKICTTINNCDLYESNN